MPSPKRFIYSAGATGVGIVLERPAPLARAWASVSLPSIGGAVASVATTADIPTALAGILSFKTAVTQITGKLENQKAVTDVITTITGLDVYGGKLTADKVELQVTLVFDEPSEALESVSISRTPYSGLVITTQTGQPVPALTLDTAVANQAGRNHDGFRGSLAKRKHHHRPHPSDPQNIKFGRAHMTLVKQALDEDQQKKEFAFVKATFGRVHFAEWAQDKDWQSIVGLRIELAGAGGGPKGTIVIADIDPNGEFYP